MTRRLWVLPLALLGACAGKAKNDVTVVPPGAPVEQIEMDPIKIAAVKGPDGTHLETYDVTELFERAGAALSDKRPADAARDYDQLLKEFPDTRYTKAALYNAGLAYEGLKDWQTAIARFQQAGQRARRHLGRQGRALPDRGLLRRARQLADLGDDLRPDPRAQGPDRRRQDRGDGPARVRAVPAQGLRHRRADLPVGASTTSTASPARSGWRPTSTSAWSATSWGRSPTSASAPFRCVLPEKATIETVDKRRGVLNDKAKLLLAAQRQYIETIKLGNPQWASAAGLPDRVALRGALRRLHPRAHPRRAAGRGQPGEARGLLRGAAQERSGSCSRSRSAPTSRTC